MTDQEFDKLPLIIQWMLTAGGLMAGIAAFVLGHWNRATSTEGALARERDRLLQQVSNDELRRDIEVVIKASREANFTRMKESDDVLREIIAELRGQQESMEQRIREIEIALARMSVSRRSR